MNPYANEIFPFPPWTVPELPRLPSYYTLVSFDTSVLTNIIADALKKPQVEDILFQPGPRVGPQVSGPDSILMDPPFQFQPQEGPVFDPSICLPSESFGMNDFQFSLPEDFKPNIPWDNPGQVDETECVVSPYKLRRSLLKLDLELLDDLDFLDSGSMSLKYPSPKEGLNPGIGRLDIPIHRALRHSTQFLELIQSESAVFDYGFGHSAMRTHQQYSPAESQNEVVEDRSTITSSVDSGYLSINDAKAIPSSKYDLSTSLTMLSTYCHLISVYRAIFGEIYQLFLIVPPTEAGSFFTMPTLNFGNFQIDGSLGSQMQVLIELSSSLIEKIEHALGMSALQNSGSRSGMSPSSPVYSPLASVREHMMTPESINCGTMLRDTMSCLQQLVKDSSNV
ncbi:hypothetical protein N7470_007014 [Penicillium chermesinum]|nr:hypothetical protein N7470_007014 [Penicillium chermesinum]